MNWKKGYIRIVLLLLTFPTFFSSCLKDVTGNTDRMAARTILYYMAGDGTLGEKTQEKVDALVASWNAMGVNQHLLIYQDRGRQYTPRLLEIKTDSTGKGRIDVLKEYEGYVIPSVNFADAINEMVGRYPRSDYGLIFFSNTTGWLPQGTYARPFSMTDSDREFSLADFANTIPDGQFKFIVFTSGLMAGAEVAYELKDKTDYILASSAEVFSPGFTPIYDKMVKKLYKESPDLNGLANDYFRHNNSSATVSVIRPAELEPLKQLLAGMESRIDYWEWIDRTNIQHFDLRESDYLFYDLEGYVRTCGLPGEVDKLSDILNRAIPFRAATNLFGTGTSAYQIEQHCGLTIYIPIPGKHELNEKREKLRLFGNF